MLSFLPVVVAGVARCAWPGRHSRSGRGDTAKGGRSLTLLLLVLLLLLLLGMWSGCATEDASTAIRRKEARAVLFPLATTTSSTAHASSHRCPHSSGRRYAARAKSATALERLKRKPEIVCRPRELQVIPHVVADVRQQGMLSAGEDRTNI